MSGIESTLGTWTNGRNTLKASYLDEGHIRIDTRDGSAVLTNAEWLRRLEIIKTYSGAKQV